MAAPTNTSEVALANKDHTARLAFILDALLGLAGGSYGPTKTNAHADSTGTDNAANISPVPGSIVDINLGNKAAYWVYVKLYNKVAAPSNADTPIQVLPVPPGGGLVKTINFPYAAGLGIRIVKGATDSDNTVVVAGDLTWNLNFTS